MKTRNFILALLVILALTSLVYNYFAIRPQLEDFTNPDKIGFYYLSSWIPLWISLFYLFYCLLRLPNVRIKTTTLVVSVLGLISIAFNIVLAFVLLFNIKV